MRKSLSKRNYMKGIPLLSFLSFRYLNPFSLKVTCLESITKLVKNVRS